MTKNKVLEKAKKVTDNDKRAVIIENRIARLEKMMTEYADDPAVILMDAVDDGYITWETLGRELIAQMSVGDLWSVCNAFDLVEESKKASDKPVTNEYAGGSVYDAAYQWAQDYLDDIEDYYWTREAGGVREALQTLADQAAPPIVDFCCDDLESEYAFELSDSDRDVVTSALAAAAEEAMQHMGDGEDLVDDDDWNEDMKDEDFEYRKRVSRKPAKDEAAKKPVKKESMKRPTKRSLVSRYKK